MPRILDTNKYSESTEELISKFKNRVVGQNRAVATIVDTFERFQAGFCDAGRTAGNLLFLGPTGSGKTLVAESLAEGLFGDSRACLKIDCAEFQHSHEIAKLIGSPPGYLGHRETHPMFTQEALNQWHTEKVKLSIVLFDEIEKASDSLWNLLLGIMDKAIITLGDNRKVMFSNAILVMTSNVGAAQMSALTGGRLGFSVPVVTTDDANSKMDDTAIEAAKKKFTPEFYNRIDDVVVFHSLTEGEIEQILNIELGRMQQRLLLTSKVPFVFHVLKTARERILKDGYNATYGARFLKRTVQRLVELPLAKIVASGQITSATEIHIRDIGADGLEFYTPEAK